MLLPQVQPAFMLLRVIPGHLDGRESRTAMNTGPAVRDASGPGYLVEDGVAVVAASSGTRSVAENLIGAHSDADVVAVVLLGDHSTRALDGVDFATMGKPTVSAIAGAADLGPMDLGALGLGCRTDARLVADSVVVSADGPVAEPLLHSLVKIIGSGRVPELLGADGTSAERLYALGLVNEVVPAHRLRQRAVRYASRLAGLGPVGLAALRGRPDQATGEHDSGGAQDGRRGGADKRPAGIRLAASRTGPQTRQRILDAAAKTLREDGYSLFRLSGVAALCGTHQTAIYHYFDSKDALVDEVLQVGVSRTFDAVREAVEAHPAEAGALGRLAVAMRVHLRMVLDPGDYAGAAIRIPGELPSSVYQRLRAVQHAYGRYWASLYRAASDDGYLRADVTLSVSRAVVAGALNYAIEWFDPRKSTVEELADEVIPTLLAGIVDPARVPYSDLKDLDRPQGGHPDGGA
jgi:AcrR family transcriptional regulator